MPLILVVEQEKRYVERIEEALGPQGWEIVAVDDRAGVMRLVADRAADLVVVNAEVDGALELVSSFSRSAGGPGTVALVPEAGDNDEVRSSADEVLEKPFTDRDIRLAVRRCLSAGREAPAVEAPAATPPPADQRLSSEELFGDVVLELEDAFSVAAGAEAAEGTAAAEPVAEEPAAEEPAAGEPIPEEPEVVEAEAEIDEALSGLETDESAVEPALEEPEPEAEEPDEIFEEEIEEEIEEELEEEIEVAEADEAAAEAVEPTEWEEDEAEEEPEVELELEEAELEEEPEPEVVEEPEPAEEVVEDEAEIGEVEPVEDIEVEKPRKPDLEDRIREAFLAGKAAAAARPTETVREVDSGEAADLLLQKALGTLTWGAESKPKIDDEFAEPAHATQEEVDELVGTVVGGRQEVEPEESFEDLEEVAPEDDGPGLDVVESELLVRQEGEYRDRMKLVWAIIVIALLAALAFVVTRQTGDETAPDTPPVEAPAAVEGDATSLEDESADAGETTAAEGEAEDGDGGSGGDDTEENGGGA
jgi:CheY-like chemotaxis protein